MEKLKFALLCTLLAAVTAVMGTGCITRNVRPGAMKELTGTYKLTKYDVTPDVTEETQDLTYEERTEHCLKTRGVEAYLIITGGMSGYYYYKDSETDWWAETIKIEYTYDEEDGVRTNDIISVKINNEAYSSSCVPGHGIEYLGFNSKKHNLNYKQHAYHGKWIKIKNTTAVVYERVSKDVTTSFVEGKIGKKLEMPRYELKQFKGLLQYGANRYGSLDESLNPFIYAFIEFDNLTLSAKLHYALKADYAEGKRGDELEKTENIAVEITNEDKTYVYLDFKFEFIAGNHVYKLYKGESGIEATGGYYYTEYDETESKYIVVPAEPNYEGYTMCDYIYVRDRDVNNLPEYVEEAMNAFAPPEVG